MRSFASPRMTGALLRMTCTCRGYTLTTLVVALLLLAVMGTVILSQFGTGMTSTVNEQAAMQAVYLAESAQQLAVRYLVDHPGWGGDPDSPNTSDFPDTSMAAGSFTISSRYPLTLLTESMTLLSTTATVASTANFPSAGRLRIDTETMTYAGKTAGTFTGLSRGADATLPAAHTAGAGVFIVSALTSAIGAGDATLPVASTEGFLDAGTIQVDLEQMDYSGLTPVSFTGVTRGAHGTVAAPHPAGSATWPGIPQCEVTTTGMVGAPGDIGRGLRTFRQTVGAFPASGTPGGGGSNVIITIIGDGNAGDSGEGGPAVSASIKFPAGVEYDDQGIFVYFADKTNHKVKRVNLITGIINTVAGVATAGNTGDGGPGAAARLRNPEDIDVDPSGTVLYIADSGNNRIRRVNLVTGVITHFAGDSGGGSGNSGDGGPAASARLNNPNGISVDSLGILYIADTGNNRVRRVLLNGNIEHVAGSAAGAAGDNPSGAGSVSLTSALFRQPNGIVVAERDDLIYITDFSTTGSPATRPAKVRRLNLGANAVTTAAGSTSSGFGGDGGPATSAQLNAPQAVDTDSAGNIYIADTGNHRVRKVTVSTGLIETVTGDGTTVFDGDGQDPLLTSLDAPEGVALDLNDEVAISDTGHKRVRKMTRDSGRKIEAVDWRELFQ